MTTLENRLKTPKDFHPEDERLMELETRFLEAFLCCKGKLPNEPPSWSGSKSANPQVKVHVQPVKLGECLRGCGGCLLVARPSNVQHPFSRESQGNGATQEEPF